MMSLMITRWGLRGGMRLLIILRLPNLKKKVILHQRAYISGFQFFRLSGGGIHVCVSRFHGTID